MWIWAVKGRGWLKSKRHATDAVANKSQLLSDDKFWSSSHAMIWPRYLLITFHAKERLAFAHSRTHTTRRGDEDSESRRTSLCTINFFHSFIWWSHGEEEYHTSNFCARGSEAMSWSTQSLTTESTSRLTIQALDSFLDLHKDTADALRWKSTHERTPKSRSSTNDPDVGFFLNLSQDMATPSRIALGVWHKRNASANSNANEQ